MKTFWILVFYLENSAKYTKMIALSLRFYNSTETGRAQAIDVMNYCKSKDNLHFDDQVDKLLSFYVTEFSIKNKKKIMFLVFY